MTVTRLIASTLRASEAKSKIVILLTDGEHNAGSIQPNATTELAASFDV